MEARYQKREKRKKNTEEKKENVVQKPLMLTRGAYARPSK